MDDPIDRVRIHQIVLIEPVPNGRIALPWRFSGWNHCPQSYIPNRAMSLWVSLNFRQFAAFTGKPDMEVPNKEELTELWSTINFKYAEELAASETGYPIAAFAPSLDLSMAQIMEYMKQSFSAVPLTPEEQARLDALYATP